MPRQVLHADLLAIVHDRGAPEHQIEHIGQRGILGADPGGDPCVVRVADLPVGPAALGHGCQVGFHEPLDFFWLELGATLVVEIDELEVEGEVGEFLALVLVVGGEVFDVGVGAFDDKGPSCWKEKRNKNAFFQLFKSEMGN